jgi:hypothetical protein
MPGARPPGQSGLQLGQFLPLDPDTILVSTGSSRLSNRFFRAQVTLTRTPGQTVIRIRPGGTSSEFPVNALGIARKIRQVLTSAPFNHQPGGHPCRHDPTTG